MLVTREAYLSQCQWPDLRAPYTEALREAVSFILTHFEDVLGIITSGTILRGEAAPSSDLDIYVVRQKLQRQRLQRFFNGVPAEIFVNPVPKILQYFDEERKQGRPLTAHMMVTGHTVLELSSKVSMLRQKARESLALPPNFDDQRLMFARYGAATRYEDALDIVLTCPATSTMILDLAVHDMLVYYFMKANRYIPRDKDLFVELRALDSELGRLAREFYDAGDMQTRLTLAEQIADRSIETHGFFVWESSPEDVS